MGFPRDPSMKRTVSGRGAAGTSLDMGRERPTLVFVGSRRCGASRRMESLVAWVKVTQKKRLDVVDVDTERSPGLARRLGVRSTPTLLVLSGGSVVRRHEGRATGRQIEALIRPFLCDTVPATRFNGEDE